jgi:hypothetical protein
MQTFVDTSQKQVYAHTFGVRVMLLTDQPQGDTARKLASFGSLVDIESTLDAALSGMLDDPMGYDLFVMDCDGFDGLDGAEQAIASLIAAQARMRVMLVCSGFDEPTYPLGRRTAVCLPVSIPDEGFRRGFDHALRDRAPMTMM